MVTAAAALWMANGLGRVPRLNPYIWYYMYEDGVMAAGTEMPDGYTVGSDGVMAE